MVLGRGDLTRIALIDCLFNKFNSFDFFSKAVGEKIPNVEVLRLTAPSPFNIPGMAKKAFSQGAEAAVIFLNYAEDDRDLVALLHEKLIDVEIKSEKFSLFCLVADEEWKTEDELEHVSQERIATIVNILEKGLEENSEEPLSPDLSDALSFMSAPPQTKSII